MKTTDLLDILILIMLVMKRQENLAVVLYSY